MELSNEIIASNPLIIENDFILFPNYQCNVRLRNKTIDLCIKDSTGKLKTNQISILDVIGCQILRGKITIRNLILKQNNTHAVYLALYSYPLKVRGIIISKPQRRERVFCNFHVNVFETREDNMKLAQKWQRTIAWLIKGLSILQKEVIPPALPPSRNFMVLVNPHSGSGKAYRIFRETVIPLFTESCTHFHLIITDRANCARDITSSTDLSQWNAIIVVSGDGLLNEVINGLMSRPDWESAIKMPLGIIPGGSGNGLARTLSYANGEPYEDNQVIPAVLNIVHGYTSPLDIVRVHTEQGPFYSFLSCGWGIMSDIDIESEKFRAIGEARFTLWALVRTLGLRKYKARVSYLPIEGFNYDQKCQVPGDLWKMTRSYTVDENLTWRDCSKQGDNFSDRNNMPRSKSCGPSSYDDQAPLNNIDSHITSKHTIIDTTPDLSPSLDSPTVLDLSESVPLSQPVPNNWKVLEREFILVYAAYQTHLGSDIFFAPYAKLNDGIIWLVLINSNVSRAQLINILSSFQSGTYANSEYVDMIPVQAFRLEPFALEGHMTIDGELIPTQTVQTEMLPAIARIFVSKPR